MGVGVREMLLADLVKPGTWASAGNTDLRVTFKCKAAGMEAGGRLAGEWGTDGTVSVSYTG